MARSRKSNSRRSRLYRRAERTPIGSSRAGSSPSSPWSSACSWRSWTSRSSPASLTEIQAGLSASANEISWVQTAYLIAEVVMIPLSGFLSRALSTRMLFAISAGGLHRRER